MSDPFGELPRGHYGAIYADPPWVFGSSWKTRTGPGNSNATYNTMSVNELGRLPVEELAGGDCALFMWGVWALLPEALEVIHRWGFRYKSCAFNWMKANGRQPDLFKEEMDVQMGIGHWTRGNSEPCFLAVRGNPHRLSANIRQGIIEPRRQHSRKPDCVPGRIERLVAGPYLELFARTTRPGWDSWGNEVDKFAPLTAAEDAADSLLSYNGAVAAIGERVKAGEPVPEFMLSQKALP